MADETPVVMTLALLFIVLFALERRAPLRHATRPLVARLVVNAVVALLAFGAAAVFVRPVALAMVGGAERVPFGLVHLVPGPSALRFGVALLLLDVTFYWWHVANHRLPLLWRFHNVHHIDPDLDVSTAFRFHLGEVALSAAFRVVQVAVVGPTAVMFVTYELLFQASTMFHHSNVRLPIGFERVLNLLIVTPRMHGIHHSQIRDETNSNYSVVLSWWDRAHRTLRLGVPQSAIAIGVPAFMHPAENRVANLLLLPLRAQRDGWPDARYLSRGAKDSARLME